jgi:hypothetical protein
VIGISVGSFSGCSPPADRQTDRQATHSEGGTFRHILASRSLRCSAHSATNSMAISAARECEIKLIRHSSPARSLARRALLEFSSRENQHTGIHNPRTAALTSAHARARTHTHIHTHTHTHTHTHCLSSQLDVIFCLSHARNIGEDENTVVLYVLLLICDCAHRANPVNPDPTATANRMNASANMAAGK